MRLPLFPRRSGRFRVLALRSPSAGRSVLLPVEQREVGAAVDLVEETEEQPRKQLLVTLLKQMERDWFGVFPPSGLLD